MPRGSKPGERRGGRQKGTPNKATQTMREQAEAMMGQPLPIVMVGWAKQLADAGQLVDAGHLAASAAKHLYPTLKSIELDGKVEIGLPEAIELGPAPVEKP